MQAALQIRIKRTVEEKPDLKMAQLDLALLAGPLEPSRASQSSLSPLSSSLLLLLSSSSLSSQP